MDFLFSKNRSVVSKNATIFLALLSFIIPEISNLAIFEEAKKKDPFSKESRDCLHGEKGGRGLSTWRKG